MSVPVRESGQSSGGRDNNRGQGKRRVHTNQGRGHRGVSVYLDVSGPCLVSEIGRRVVIRLLLLRHIVVSGQRLTKNL